MTGKWLLRTLSIVGGIFLVLGIFGLSAALNPTSDGPPAVPSLGERIPFWISFGVFLLCAVARVALGALMDIREAAVKKK